MARIILLLVASLATNAWAQQIHVDKVKGNKAVIQFSGGTLNPGQTYVITKSAATGQADSREHVFGISFNYDNLETASAKANAISLISRYGWNYENFEVGPFLKFSNTTNDSLELTSFILGLFADYNFVPNRPGTEYIYGIGGEAGFGTGTVSTTAGGATAKSTSSSTSFYGSGFMKWFPLASSIGFRGDLGYSYAKQTTSSSDQTTQGFSLRAGVVTYF